VAADLRVHGEVALGVGQHRLPVHQAAEVRVAGHLDLEPRGALELVDPGPQRDALTGRLARGDPVAEDAVAGDGDACAPDPPAAGRQRGVGVAQQREGTYARAGRGQEGTALDAIVWLQGTEA
jgi:hypothetical protein